MLYPANIKCSPLYVLMWIMALVSGSVEKLLLYTCALLLHEGAHCLMAGMLGCKISEIKLLPYGCRMNISQMDSPWDELLIAMSGPVCSIICFMGSRMIPWASGFAEAHMYIAVINLLPVFPLDGGRAAGALLSLSGYTPARKLRSAGAFALAGVVGACGYAAKNATLLIFSVFLISEGIALLRNAGHTAMSYIKNARCIASGRGLQVRHIALWHRTSVETALSYGIKDYCVFCIVDDNMREIARTDGARLAELAAELGSETSLGDIIPFIDRSK